jgi:hypothetical protein
MAVAIPTLTEYGLTPSLERWYASVLRVREVLMRFQSPLVLVLVCALVAPACGDRETPDDDEDDDAGEGGTGGSNGGAGGVGGGSGGSGGTGGATGGGPTGGTGGGTTGGAGGATGGSGGTGGSTGGTGGAMGGTGGATGGTGGSTTGGTSGTGGAMGGTGGTGVPPTCGAAFHAEAGGYVTTPSINGSCWQGYAYTGTQVAGSTIAPADFSECGDPCMLCASGSVAPDPDFGGVAWLGFNLAQAAGEATTAGTITPTGTGIRVNFINEAGSTLRVQLAGPNGDTLASDRWCVEVAGATGEVMIPYAAFNTQCWNALGTAYAGQPLQNIQLIVPGSDLGAIAFAMCMAAVTEY